MNFSDLLDVFASSSAAETAPGRLQHALGGGSPLGGGMGGGLGEMLGGLLGGGMGGGTGRGGGGLGDLAGSLLGGGGSPSGFSGGGGGLGQMLGGLLGGGGRSSGLGGGLGGALLPLLAGLAMNAFKGFSASEPPPPAEQLPVGLRAPRDTAEEQTLERNAQVIIQAMINAAKADGNIDQTEMQNIMGRLKEAGADHEARGFILDEMARPLDMRGLVGQVDSQELAAQVYAASLLAIKVDTPAERGYIEELGRALGLSPQVSANIQQSLGM